MMAPMTDGELDAHLRTSLSDVWTVGELGDPYALLLRAPDDPYPLYERIREHGPLYHSRIGVWVTPDHALGTKVLRDRRFGINLAGGRKRGPQITTFDNSFLGLDPPDHTRLRRIASPFLGPSTVSRYRGMIERVCHDLLDRLPPGEPFDLMAEFATQVPIIVIGRLFGIPDEHQDRFHRHGRGVSVLLDGVGSVKQARGLQVAVDGLRAVFADLLELRQVQPGEDIVSGLLACRDDAALTTDELLAMCGMLALAGTETTVNLIGNGVHALLRHPEQWALLRDDPGLAPKAVEETLRWDTSVQQSDRIAHEDVELAGVALPADTQVVVLTAAANRDPAVYPDPDRFDITRDVKPDHLSFSGGLHYCLGAPLARLEAEVALGTLAARLGGLHSAGPTRRRRSPIIRGLLRLPVSTS
jgi:P450-derived glycosyltransferase activator